MNNHGVTGIICTDQNGMCLGGEYGAPVFLDLATNPDSQSIVNNLWHEQ